MDNPQIELARQIIETTDTHLFLTGRAGTGKTTFLRRLRTESPKRMVVLAPTGIAAINAGGVTIHSFFQLSFAPYIPGTKVPTSYAMTKQKIALIKSIDLLVIDEISMVRADLLDVVDYALRKYRRNSKPFGGVQLLLIGDLQQLAPVVKDEEWSMLKQHYPTPYFFSSNALCNTNYVTVELEKVYRQSDGHFLALLNEVREGNVSQQTLDALNQRYLPNFVPQKSDGYIQLVTHNWQAQQVNSHEMDKLPGQTYTYKAVIKGKFSEMSYPTDEVLSLKLGAQVMFVKNDSNKHYYNGMIGEIVDISDQSFTVRPNNDPDKLVKVQPEAWENTRYAIDEETKEIKEVVEGTFSQYPVKLAWAITIHKSQGLTFERVMIDAHASFAHGQTYVALSRCKTLEGIVLTSTIPSSAIIADKYIDQFNAHMRAQHVDEEKLSAMRNAYSLSLISDLFNFEKERILLAALTRILQEYLYKIYGETAQSYEQHLKQFNAQVFNVSIVFHAQYQQLLALTNGNINDAQLQERIRKGAAYFADKLYDLRNLVQALHLDIDNASVAIQLDTTQKDLIKQLRVHSQLLENAAEEGFDTKAYLRKRARILLEAEDKQKSKAGDKKSKAAEAKSNAKVKQHTAADEGKYTIPSEVKNAMLYYRLQSWRREKASAIAKPAYTVLSTKSLMAIANYMPMTEADLKRIPHFGQKSFEKYGLEIMQLIAQYKEDKETGKISQAEEDAQPHVQNASLPNESTYDTTLRLFREGKTPAEIAEVRDLTQGTIMSHLSRFVENGDVPFEAVVPEAHFERIKKYFEQHPYHSEVRIVDVRNELGEDILYAEIRLSLFKMGLIKEVKL